MRAVGIAAGHATVTRLVLSCAGLLLITITPVARAYEADRVVIVMLDGPRLSETFEDPAHLHVPRMWNDLLPQSVHVPEFRNDGSTRLSIAAYPNPFNPTVTIRLALASGVTTAGESHSRQLVLLK